MSSFNDQIIAEFRANGGRVARFGSSLVLLHTIGAKTGEARVSPVMAIEDGDSWLVVASAAGAVRHPAWFFNLQARPDVTIETPNGTVDVYATPLDGAAYDEAWLRFVERAPTFADYRERAGDRTIPVVRLERMTAASR
jgi:deazaflavin-dependent oxidoreductase (nitroreductase family)